MRRAQFLAFLGTSALFPLASLRAAETQLLVKGSPLPISEVNGATINQKLDRELLTEDLAALAKKALQAPAAKTPEEWLRRLAILVRADYRDDAKALLAHRPAFLTSDKEWRIAERVETDLLIPVCALYPEQRLLTYGIGDPNFQRWIKSTDPATVENWLMQRVKQAPTVWLDVYASYRVSQGTQAAFYESLKVQVQANPANFPAIESYLTLAHPQDSAWLAGVVKLKLAVENYQVALAIQESPTARILLLERTLEIGFTDEDSAWYTEFLKRNPFHYHIRSSNIPPKQLEQAAKYQLREAYKQTGQIEKAKALDAPPPPPPSLGAPPIVENKDTAAYWQARGSELRERKEYEESKKSFEKALELAPPTLDDTHQRIPILYSYFQLLYESTAVSSSAKQLYRNELDKVPLSGASARLLIGALTGMDRYTKGEERLMTIDDSLYLRFLEQSVSWHSTQETLILCLLEHCPDTQTRKQAVETLATLAQKSPEARAETLGIALSQTEFTAEALTWLETTRRVIPRECWSYGVLVNLWRLSLKSNDWKKAEAIQAEYDMSPRSFWELALAAARAGERKEALRFYRRYLNFDRRNVESVSLLLDQGMKSELTALYTQLVQDEPRAFTRQRLEKASLAERLLR